MRSVFSRRALYCAAVAAGATGNMAMAQSSVTIYGAVDLAVTGTHGNLGSSTQLNSGENYTSRIGFTGKEDLGGGLYAGFDLESQINPDSGSGTVTSTNNQSNGATTGSGLTFNRYAIVKMGGKWGELRLGRDYTQQYRNRVDVDPFLNQGITTSQAQTGSIAGLTGVRASNMVNYVTPDSFGGLFAVTNYYMGENSSSSANKKDGTGQAVRIGYRAGPWLAAFATSKTYYVRTATTGDTTSNNLALSYNFGFARLMAGYYQDKVERTTDITGKGYILGTTVPVGGNEIRASYSRYGTDARFDPTSSKIAIGYVYNLSKRTVLYANAVRLGNSGGASAALAGSLSSANTGSRGYEAGLRQLF